MNCFEKKKLAKEQGKCLPLSVLELAPLITTTGCLIKKLLAFNKFVSQEKSKCKTEKQKDICTDTKSLRGEYYNERNLEETKKRKIRQ